MHRRILLPLGACVVLVVLALAGPRVALVDTFEPFPADVDLTVWVEKRAGEYADIVPETAHRIIWADSSRHRTPWSIVYLHGFSGSSAMAFPMVDSLAGRLGANAYLPRLAGHGRGPEAFGEALLADWIQDTADAIAIGERLGHQTLVVGLSTGATLALWAAGHPALSQHVDAIALLSPNIAPRDPRVGMLLWPWGRQLAEAIAGKTRRWEPRSELHSRYTTNEYPTKAVLQMMASVALLARQDPSGLQAPVLFILSDQDQVVDPVVSRQYFERIPTRKRLVEVGNVGDPNNHVIVGDALSPQQTMPAVETILAFLAAGAE